MKTLNVLTILNLGVLIVLLYFLTNNNPIQIVKNPESIRDTIYITNILCETIIFTKDTCDSQFIKSIAMIESNGKPNAVGDGGKALGVLQIHRRYFQEANLPFDYTEVTNPEVASLTFWSTMLKYGKWYYRRFKRLPTYNDLARLHNGGYGGVTTNKTDYYVVKMNRVFGKSIDNFNLLDYEQARRVLRRYN